MKLRTSKNFRLNSRTELQRGANRIWTVEIPRRALAETSAARFARHRVSDAELAEFQVVVTGIIDVLCSSFSFVPVW